ncbi:hypothetical protein BWQ96_05098 [Gracilariopsis chorda]|uniref:Uncharacterized protein n=1 Tax=Gracilariopsis chorda TaxID=448386 RepID=A0A2V3ISP0_9FLOR|nr:hypothetical protein BWQ96_05098 [Gracilariopsis chorda]|eukprot:PXF45124.1 hypothetical protein BWQ96_05098 [Gracilariopsis chorda]
MAAFISQFAIPFDTSLQRREGTPKPRRQVSNPSKAPVLIPRASVAESSGGGTWKPDDFDRDYYDELKEEFKDNKKARIFAKEDYQLDDIETPWLFDYRARNLEEIRKRMTTRPKENPDPHSVPENAMLLSDLHTEEEIADFEDGLRTNDQINGKKWRDPMREEDFSGDPEWIGFRKKSDEDVTLKEHESLASLGEEGLLPRKPFNSEKDEWEALNDSYDMMQTEFWDSHVEPFSVGGNTEVPSPEEFARWQKEAEARGGGATSEESYFLPPFNDPTNNNASVSASTQQNFPDQHKTFATSNCGTWEGTLRVFSIHYGQEEFVPRIERVFSSRTAVSPEPREAVMWSTTVIGDSCDYVSEREIPLPKHPDALISGRAVSSEGSYAVCRINGLGNQNTDDYFTMSRVCIESITGDNKCRPELEISLLTRQNNGSVRDRIFLCTSPDTDRIGGRGKTKVRFSHIISLNEYLGTTSEKSKADVLRHKSSDYLESANIEQLLGHWTGRGALFHPEYPPMSFTEVTTDYSVSRSDSVTQSDVTWGEKRVPDDPTFKSRGRERTLRKKKVSKRVKAARDHDRRRLSECRLITRERNGSDAEEERFAWKALPCLNAFSTLYSPRVGHFVGDYCGLLTSRRVLVTFPVSDAFPDMWNTASVIYLNRPSRQRIEVGRNERGALVGALFIRETIEDAAEGDAVAAYV